MSYQVTYQIKIAEFDLSVFTGMNTQVVLTADESAHGYNYHVTTYIEGTDGIFSNGMQTFNFYDQPTADKVVTFMATKIKEILG